MPERLPLRSRQQRLHAEFDLHRAQDDGKYTEYEEQRRVESSEHRTVLLMDTCIMELSSQKLGIEIQPREPDLSVVVSFRDRVIRDA